MILKKSTHAACNIGFFSLRNATISHAIIYHQTNIPERKKSTHAHETKLIQLMKLGVTNEDPIYHLSTGFQLSSNPLANLSSQLGET